MTALAGWVNFYVIVGSSAGALIGLQFVVMALIAGMPHARVDGQTSSAFGTPTIVHLGSALLLSAALSAPWRGAATPAVLWGLVGLLGVAYTVIVARRMRAQSSYQPEFEDWLCHVLLPFTAYIALTVSACLGRSHLPGALFAVGAAALLLLFIGIHNAWDSATYHIVTRKRDDAK